MNNLEGSVSHAGSAKQRLLEQSARILAKGGRDALQVCAVAEQIDVPVDEAKSFLKTTTTLSPFLKTTTTYIFKPADSWMKESVWQRLRH